MGIRGGVKNYIVRDILGLPNSGVARVPLSNFRGKRIVVDWANIAYRFLSRSISLAHFKNEFINLIHKFARYGIELIFVFDGKPRDEKAITTEHRKTAREKVLDKIGNIIENVSNPEEDFETIMHLARRVKTLKLSHVNACKKLFHIHGIKYIHLEDIEADSIFNLILENKFADLCFSGDMDLLAFGCKRMIIDLNFKEDTVVEIDYEILLTYFGVSQQQLLMAFILSGTDWNNSLKKTNFIKNLELIKKYGDIPSIIANLDEINRDLPVDSHIKPPNRFDWQFSLAVYSEVLSSENITRIQDSLKLQEEQIETLHNSSGFNIVLEYGKTILEQDPDYKYARKYQEYIFWKYSYRLNLIPSNSTRHTQQTPQYTKQYREMDIKQTQKKIRN